jgi:hypothetical protein
LDIERKNKTNDDLIKENEIKSLKNEIKKIKSLLPSSIIKSYEENEKNNMNNENNENSIKILKQLKNEYNEKYSISWSKIIQHNLYSFLFSNHNDNNPAPVLNV